MQKCSTRIYLYMFRFLSRFSSRLATNNTTSTTKCSCPRESSRSINSLLVHITSHLHRTSKARPSESGSPFPTEMSATRGAHLFLGLPLEIHCFWALLQLYCSFVSTKMLTTGRAWNRVSTSKWSPTPRSLGSGTLSRKLVYGWVNQRQPTIGWFRQYHYTLMIKTWPQNMGI